MNDGSMEQSATHINTTQRACMFRQVLRRTVRSGTMRYDTMVARQEEGRRSTELTD